MLIQKWWLFDYEREREREKGKKNIGCRKADWESEIEGKTIKNASFSNDFVMFEEARDFKYLWESFR
jgi:hypothetical protein